MYWIAKHQYARLFKLLSYKEGIIISYFFADEETGNKVH